VLTKVFMADMGESRGNSSLLARFFSTCVFVCVRDRARSREREGWFRVQGSGFRV